MRSINCGNIKGKNNQALGLVAATKKPPFKKEKKFFDVIVFEFISFGEDLWTS